MAERWVPAEHADALAEAVERYVGRPIGSYRLKGQADALAAALTAYRQATPRPHRKGPR